MILIGEGFRHGLVVVDVLYGGQDQLGLLIVDGNGNLLEGLFLAIVQGERFHPICPATFLRPLPYPFLYYIAPVR